ncbi:MAG TPA: hypothetical protein VGC31_07785 [Paenirhodobacter sp.]
MAESTASTPCSLTTPVSAAVNGGKVRATLSGYDLDGGPAAAEATPSSGGAGGGLWVDVAGLKTVIAAQAQYTALKAKSARTIYPIRAEG